MRPADQNQTPTGADAKTASAPITIRAASSPLLTPELLQFLGELETRFGPTRERLLKARRDRQAAIDKNPLAAFQSGRVDVPEARTGDWRVAPCPKDLENRTVEITGPAEPKMIINALNSGANVFMADFEDSLSPTWKNILDGQAALHGAVRGELSFKSPEGKEYKLGAKRATLKVRPRGWHLTEKNALLDGRPMSASLFDFGFFFFHNAAEALKRGSGPYFYLPKMESHFEARLWNDVFTYAQKRLGIPHGSVRATMLIETLPAAFEMEEFLYELRDHASGLNAGRWDYIFSLIKKLRNRPEANLPDRSQVTMTVPFMAAYAKLLVAACHKRGAHAMGGMSAFIPSRKDEAVNKKAFEQVKADKKREASLGFDGTWVAHPDLIEIAREEFVVVLGPKPNQKSKPIETTLPRETELVATDLPGTAVTETGARNNINVALQYLRSWLAGVGAAAIHNLMEDAATAEISRAQLWAWLKVGRKLADGRTFTVELYETWKKEELAKLAADVPAASVLLTKAEVLLDRLVLNVDFEDFLTLPAYEQIT
ncbi:MAG: malate synthase A [Bdellovibrionales bacterium]|nr:malate synthase A [Bdellovibrionales bacterium]